MLIAHAEIHGAGTADVRIEQGRITDIGSLTPADGERIINARGGALLPGLNDHHIHLMSFAASLVSVRCGPPEVRTEDELTAALERRARTSDGDWIRGIGYHESVAGDVDRDWLDRRVPDTPVRVQHRSGRLWIVNSPGLALLADAARDAGTALPDGFTTGQIYGHDGDLRRLWHPAVPPVRRASERLAAFGVTGITDMTPDNSTLATFASLQSSGALLQSVYAAGRADMSDASGGTRLHVGPTKIHLHETSLPPFDELCRIIASSHARDRPVAIHCVTEAELVFALAALRQTSPHTRDRIEHASVTPPALLEQLRELDLTVVTQPHFVAERGDAYLDDVATGEQAWLYRCRAFLDMGIKLAGGTDAPFGDADPWRAMQAAVTRRTHRGTVLGAEETVTPEQALTLFLGTPEHPEHPRRIAIGGDADLCLLDRPWSEVRGDLSSEHVRATVRSGELIHDRGDRR